MAEAKAKELGLEEPRLRRAIRKPAKLREAGEDASQPKSPEDAYRSEYIAAMDGLAASLHHRFSGGDDTVLRGVEAALAGDEAEGRQVAAFCGLDADRADLHLRFMHDMAWRPAKLKQAADASRAGGSRLGGVRNVFGTACGRPTASLAVFLSSVVSCSFPAEGAKPQHSDERVCEN